MQFQPRPIQPFTISTACNFIRSHFQPTAISTYHTSTKLLSNSAKYEMKSFMLISEAIKRNQQLTIIFHTMKCDNHLQRFGKNRPIRGTLSFLL